MSVITLKKKYEKSTVKQYLRAPSVIPVLGYNKEKKYFLMDDKTVGIGFFCTPLNGADEKIQERVNGMLNLDMPAKTIMQFAMFRSPDINSQMYQMQALRQRNVNPLLQAVIDERVRFLKHHTGKSLTTRNDRSIRALLWPEVMVRRSTPNFSINPVNPKPELITPIEPTRLA